MPAVIAPPKTPATLTMVTRRLPAAFAAMLITGPTKASTIGAVVKMVSMGTKKPATILGITRFQSFSIHDITYTPMITGKTVEA